MTTMSEAQRSGADPRSAPVATVMTPSPVTIALDDDLWTALRVLLATGLRHLVVVDADKKCRGVLADRYVVVEWPGDAIGARATRVSQMLGEPSPLLKPETTIGEAAQAMLSFGTDALAVVDQFGEPVGVVTGSDLIRSLAEVTEPDATAPGSLSVAGT